MAECEGGARLHHTSLRLDHARTRDDVEGADWHVQRRVV